MADIQLYEAIVVDGAPDPELPGYIKVQIPKLFDDEVLPILIPPVYPGWVGGGWQSIPTAINPDGSEEPVRVIVVRIGRESFRWIGTSQGFPLIEGVPPGTRAGAQSGDGRHTVYMDNALGVFLTVASDTENTDSYIVIQPDNTIQMQTADGAYFRLAGPQATLLNNAGDILMMDATDGITLMHQNGVAYLSLKSGDVANLSGTTVQLGGGTIEFSDGVIPPIHGFILSLTLLADISLLCSDVVAIGAAIPSGLPFVATNAISMIAKIATSLGTGPPYLSARTFGD